MPDRLRFPKSLLLAELPVDEEADRLAASALHKHLAGLPTRKLIEHEHGILRVKVEDRPGMPQFGVLLGLLLDEHGDTQAVVRLDHYGLMLKAVHPSKVVPVTPEEEEERDGK